MAFRLPVMRVKRISKNASKAKHSYPIIIADDHLELTSGLEALMVSGEKF